MAFLYDLSTGKYYDADTGEEITREEQENKSIESIADSQSTTDIMSDLLEQELIDVDTLDESAWQAIKDEHIRQYLLAKGGRENMTQADWGRIGGLLSDQKRFYNDMMQELRDGNISVAELRRRLQMYVNSSSEAFYRALALEALRTGHSEVNWVLGVTENHCPTCERWDAMGWQPACENGGFPADDGCQFPGNGNTECVTNCVCSLEYRDPNNKSVLF